LATRYGTTAIDLVHRKEFGRMVAVHGTDIVSIPLEEAINRTRLVGQDLLDVASGLHEPMGDRNMEPLPLTNR
jgi:6-phosphofructokinase 1